MMNLNRSNRSTPLVVRLHVKFISFEFIWYQVKRSNVWVLKLILIHSFFNFFAAWFDTKITWKYKKIVCKRITHKVNWFERFGFTIWTRFDRFWSWCYIDWNGTDVILAILFISIFYISMRWELNSRTFKRKYFEL